MSGNPDKNPGYFPGELVTTPEDFLGKAGKVRALIFDWDGIFNDGRKGEVPSTFNEVDSMGINMLRFGYYLLHGTLPYAAIVTGEKNETAWQWAQREHFHAVFFRVKHKIQVLDDICGENGLRPDESAFFFDDIHDLSLAGAVGLRIMVRNAGASLLADYCRKHQETDYITKNHGGNMALREVSEMILENLGLFEKTVARRSHFDESYQEYLSARDQVKSRLHEVKHHNIS